MNQYIAILGRQPELSATELDCVYGVDNTEHIAAAASLFSTQDQPDVQKLGGALKLGSVTSVIKKPSWHDVSKKIIHHYVARFKPETAKITLGISVYGWNIPSRDVQKLALTIKAQSKKYNVRLRLIPNSDTALSTATSHHNKLGLRPNNIEIIIVRTKSNDVIVADSIGAQNISALAARDQGRPKRDAFVGMLPPKLALMMLNMASPKKAPARILDPFCGTGVLLQEAVLLGHDVYGTDLSDKMIDYSGVNLEWLTEKYHLTPSVTLHPGDAMTTTWQQPIDAVVCETYLGQPFSAPPSPAKLAEVQKNCNYIISSFLKNLHNQLPSGTPLCVAVPAWKDKEGYFTHLPLTRSLDTLGYSYRSPNRSRRLLYFREDQVVARELLILETV